MPQNIPGRIPQEPEAGRGRHAAGFLGSSTTESSTEDLLVGTPDSTAEVILSKSLDTWDHDGERVVVIPSLKVTLLTRARTGARPGCPLAGEQNLWGTKNFSYQDKYLNATLKMQKNPKNEQTKKNT